MTPLLMLPKPEPQALYSIYKTGPKGWVSRHRQVDRQTVEYALDYLVNVKREPCALVCQQGNLIALKFEQPRTS